MTKGRFFPTLLVGLFAAAAATIVQPARAGAATHLRWLQTGSDVDGFRVYIQDGSGNFSLLRDLGWQTPVDGVYSYPLDGLIEGDSWLAMSAYNDAGESDLSAPMLISPPPLCTSDAECAVQDACRLGVCAPGTGCGTLNVSDGTPCDDGNPSTSGDQCVAGVCTAPPSAPPPTCDVSIRSILPGMATGRVGETVSFLAVSNASCTPHIRWLVSRDGGNWDILRDYGVSPLFGWTPQVPGSYRIAVSAKAAGTANEQDWEMIPFEVASRGCEAVQMLEPTGPVLRHVPALVSASDAGACEYRFHLLRNGRRWLVLRRFSEDPSFVWIPRMAGGDYEIAVEVRNAGERKSLGYTSVPVQVMEESLLQCSAAGGMITCHAQPSSEAEYQWFVFEPGSRHARLLERFGEAGDTISFPAAPGSGRYVVIVWVRSAPDSSLRRGIIYKARERLMP